jgi:hypothetical protein
MLPPPISVSSKRAISTSIDLIRKSIRGSIKKLCSSVRLSNRIVTVITKRNFASGSHRLLAALLVLGLAAPAAMACDVPVFRYALERWRAETYQLVVFRKGPLGEREREALRLLEQGDAAPVNCQTLEVDLNAPLDDGLKELWASQSSSTTEPSPALPRAVLRPKSPGAAAVTIWSGPLTAEAIRSLVDSPARREIARRILAGDTIVWLFLESGDRAADDRAAARVESRLRKLEKEVKLREAAPAAGDLAADTTAAEKPSERAVPLKIQFSVLRVARNDPAEALLVDFLLKMRATSQPGDLTRAAVFPTFGRGRVLCSMEGEDIDDDMREAAEFLNGPCSCELKELNPGMDLLMAADWDRALRGEQLTAPELVGVAGMLAKAAPATPPSSPSMEPAAGGPESCSCPLQSPLFKSLLAVTGAAAALLALATVVRLRRTRRPGA